MEDEVAPPAHLGAYDREKLYREVWAEPVRAVAIRYGVSDVALAKACRRLKVPLPGVGYWAKKKVGKAPERPPLPELSAEDQARLQWASWARTQQRAQQGRPMIAPEKDDDQKPRPEIQVAERLKQPHALVKEARELLRSPGSRQGYVSCRNKPCLDIDVSRGSLTRALLIMDALLKGLEQQGYPIEVTKPHESYAYYGEARTVPGVTRVLVDEDWIQFGLSEYYKSAEVHQPNSWGGYSIQRVAKPTGALSLFVTNAPSGFRTTWNDGKKQRVEECLGPFVSYLPLIAAKLKENRLEAERRHQLRLEEERRRAEAEARRKEEERRVAELDEALRRWRRARDIRDFVAAVRQAATSESGEELQPDFEERLSWTLAYADIIDPIPGLIQPPISSEGEP